MRKIFESSEGVEFFTDEKSIIGLLSKEEAMEFVTEVVKFEIEIEDYLGFETAIRLLEAIRMSYMQTEVPTEIVVEIQ